MTPGKLKLFSAFLLSLLFFLTFSCSEVSDPVAPEEESLIEMKVTFTPIKVKTTNGKVNILYGVELPNFEKQGYKLKDFQVLNSKTNTLLCSIKDTTKYLLLHKAYDKSLISDEYNTPKSAVHSTFRISIGLLLDPGQVPQELKHKIILTKDGNDKIIEETETVSEEQPPVISPPLKGSGLVAGATTSLENNHHPSFQLTYKGKTTVIERYCVDWVKLDEAGNYFSGDPNVLESWYIYGQEVYSVADGTVIAIETSFPDQQMTGPQYETTVYNGTGNYVVIQINGGYAVYCHFKPNSITVKSGQKVTRGQLIGRVGNSGDSTPPHLHFGLHSEFPYYISESLPYYINSLEKTGIKGGLYGPYTKLAAPETRTNEIVENYGVYNLK